jgi:hypothetical protein
MTNKKLKLKHKHIKRMQSPEKDMEKIVLNNQPKNIIEAKNEEDTHPPTPRFSSVSRFSRIYREQINGYLIKHDTPLQQYENWLLECKDALSSEDDVNLSSELRSSLEPFHPPTLDIVVFDFDNTLFPSFYLGKKNRLYNRETDTWDSLEDYKPKIQNLDNLLSEMFTAILKITPFVYIITQATYGFVYTILKKYLPSFPTDKVRVLSTMTIQEMYGNRIMHPVVMKSKAFCETYKEACKNSSMHNNETVINVYNVLSIGDSNCERNALFMSGMEKSRCDPSGGNPSGTSYLKSVKFVSGDDLPNFEDIIDQLTRLHNSFHILHKHRGELDLAM